MPAASGRPTVATDWSIAGQRSPESATPGIGRIDQTTAGSAVVSSGNLSSNAAALNNAERLFRLPPPCFERRALGVWLSVRCFVDDQERHGSRTEANNRSQGSCLAGSATIQQSLT